MPIREPIKSVGKGTAVYGLGNMLTKLAAFLLIPIYTRFLTMAEVGIVALFEMVEMFLLPLIFLGVNNALWRYLPELTDEEKRGYISSALSGVLVLGLLLAGLISLNYRVLGLALGLATPDVKLFLILLLNTFLLVGPRFLISLWQYDEKPVAFVTLSLGQFLGILGITLYFVVFKGWGLWGVLYAKTIILGVLFLYAILVVFRTNHVKPSLANYFKLVKYGGPLLLMVLVAPVLTFSDRFFLRLFISLEEIGVYSIGYKFGMLINMILVIPLQRSWKPMMYKLGLSEEKQTYFRDILFYFGIVGGLFSLGIIFFSQPVISFFATEAYLPATAIIPLVTFAYYVNGFQQFFSAGAALKDKTLRLGTVALFGIMSNLLLNFFLIRAYGVMGAAWSTLFSYTLLTGLVYQTSQRVINIDWGWNRLIGLFILIFVSLGVVVWFRQIWTEIDILIGLAGLGLFTILLLVTGIVGRREINGLMSILADIRNIMTRNSK